MLNDNEDIPSFTIPQFSVEQELCGIDKYELYENIDDSETHFAFQPTGTVEEDGTVRFTVLERESGNYNYYVKVTALGGEVWWSE